MTPKTKAPTNLYDFLLTIFGLLFALLVILVCTPMGWMVLLIIGLILYK